jgi:hypothetical protein
VKRDRVTLVVEKHAVTLHVEGANVFGDLRVTGFASVHTAQQVAAEFAEGLRRVYPGALVLATFENEPCERCGFAALTDDQRHDGNRQENAHVELAGREITPEGQVTEKSRPVRVTACGTCGCWVESWDRHTQWHALLDVRLNPTPGQVAKAAAESLRTVGRRRA